VSGRINCIGIHRAKLTAIHYELRVRSRGRKDVLGTTGSDGKACKLLVEPLEDSKDWKSSGGSWIGATMASGVDKSDELAVAGLPAWAKNPQPPKKPRVLPPTIRSRNLR
jgi:hypothetical protein